jgi:tripartite-type tricarboxylate transporter receptor subunit TctC
MTRSFRHDLTLGAIGFLMGAAALVAAADPPAVVCPGGAGGAWRLADRVVTTMSQSLRQTVTERS